MLTAALTGKLDDAQYRRDDNFGFEVPVAVAGVSDLLLDPRRTWDDKSAYDAQARKLAEMFAQNFAQYEAHVDDEVMQIAVTAA